MPTTTTNHYYLEIEGFSDFLDRRAERIVGLETPDDRTLVIRLTEPVADLPDRLAKGVTAPIPPNPSRPEAPFGAAQGHGGGYGRFLIGTGPYMLEGSEDLDLPRPPGRQEPIAGYTPTTYDEAGRVLYLVMRLAVPPFDDHHVRRAVAHAIDEAALVDEITEDPRRFQEQWAVPFTHMAIDPLEGDVLAGYDPFPADPALARAEMSRSDYDDDRDGRCDARRVATSCCWWTRSPSAGPRQRSSPSSSAGSGCASEPEIGNDVYASMWTLRQHVPMLLGFGWGGDFPNASSFLEMPNRSTWILPTNGLNWSLVGASPEQLDRWGYDVTHVPSADAWIERCISALGTAQVRCWADVDRYLMERITGMIPYLSLERLILMGPRVATFTETVPPILLALDRISLTPGSS